MFIDDPRDLPTFCAEALRQAAILIGYPSHPPRQGNGQGQTRVFGQGSDRRSVRIW